MELLTTIINELTDVKISLTSPLLKTKVMASRIGNKPLLEWVNKELTGYKITDFIPDYRKTKAEVCGDYQMGHWKVTNEIINFPEFDEETTQRLYQMELTQSIQSLESLKADGNNYIAENFDQGQRQVIENYLSSQNTHFKLNNIFRRTPSTFVHDALSNVRDSLLNFMIQLEETYSYVSEIKELKTHSQEISKIMYTTINVKGDSNIITAGDENNINSTLNLNQDGASVLKSQLLLNGLDEGSIAELLLIVDIEHSEGKGQYGDLVKTWLIKMIGKSIDKSWNMPLSNAGAVLSDAIDKYYGY